MGILGRKRMINNIMVDYINLIKNKLLIELFDTYNVNSNASLIFKIFFIMQYRAFVSKEYDDIYFYGGMDIKGEKSWILSRKDISLESELIRGRFAIIYLAQYYTHQEAITVVAKALKGILEIQFKRSFLQL